MNKMMKNLMRVQVEKVDAIEDEKVCETKLGAKIDAKPNTKLSAKDGTKPCEKPSAKLGTKLNANFASYLINGQK